jgi:hypothetical protein
MFGRETHPEPPEFSNPAWEPYPLCLQLIPCKFNLNQRTFRTARDRRRYLSAEIGTSRQKVVPIGAVTDQHDGSVHEAIWFLNRLAVPFGMAVKKQLSDDAMCFGLSRSTLSKRIGRSSAPRQSSKVRRNHA